MNIFYSAALVLLGTAAGFYLSKRVKERETGLNAAILLVKELTVRIRYTNSKIGDVLKDAAADPTYSKLSFVTAYAGLQETENFHDIWSEAVKKENYLNRRDKELLLALGERLGSTDTDGQLSFLEMTEVMLTGQQREAQDDCCKKVKMYRSVGILCGLALGIIVI